MAMVMAMATGMAVKQRAVEAKRQMPRFLFVYRLCLSVVAALALYHATSAVVINVVGDGLPPSIIRFTGEDGNIAALRADRLLAEAVGARTSLAKVASLARGALLTQPLNPRAVRILAFVAYADERSGHADRLIDLSTQLSRRDFGAQLALIERAVARNDIPAALRSYDVGLRTNPEGQNVLLPVLTTALGDAEVRQAFAPYYRRNPQWLVALIGYALGPGNAATSIAQSIRAGGGLATGQVYRDLETQVLARLTEGGAADEARAFFLSVHPQRADMLKRTDFDGEMVDPMLVPFSWRMAAKATMANDAAPDDQRKRSGIRLSAAPGEVGELLAKIFFISPENHRFSVSLAFDADVTSRGIDISVICATPTQDLLQRIIVERGTSTTITSIPFNSNGRCRAIWLKLSGVNSSADLPVSVVVTEITLL